MCRILRPGTLNAGRGAKARRARRRVLRLRPAELLLLPGLLYRERRNWLWRRLGLVVGSTHARGRTRRASPGLVRSDMSGGCHGACALLGMTRTNNKPSFQRAAILAERACAMRASPTSTEQLLWHRVRGRRLGVLFRRQVPLLGRFIADFLAPAQRLVIEVDGEYHGERPSADARRDVALARAGYRVVRIEASLVVSDIECAVAQIRAALATV